jgi:hypothetical protein
VQERCPASLQTKMIKSVSALVTPSIQPRGLTPGMRVDSSVMPHNGVWQQLFIPQNAARKTRSAGGFESQVLKTSANIASGQPMPSRWDGGKISGWTCEIYN